MSYTDIIQPIARLASEAYPYSLVAGPCSAETPEQVWSTAQALHRLGVRHYRASLWKPRTRPGSFEGVGSRGIPWLKRVQDELGMAVSTEVATPQHIEQMLGAGFDTFWIGARTTSSPFAMSELAETLRGCGDVCVLVKNPINPDVELWEGGILRLLQAGVREVGAIHRGFSTYTPSQYRNPPLWQIAIELRRRHPELTLLLDPSHIAGRRDLILSLCQTALDLQYSGLVIESHISPDTALSDAHQQLSPDQLSCLLDQLTPATNRDDVSGSLVEWREQIDQIDEELLGLLSERMKLSREIGRYKHAHNLCVLQPTRYRELLGRRLELAEHQGLPLSFVQQLFALIHEQSVREQEPRVDL